MLQLLFGQGPSETGEEVKIPPLGSETIYPIQFVSTGVMTAGSAIIEVSPTCELNDWITVATITSAVPAVITTYKNPMVRARARTNSSFAGFVLVLLEHGSGE